MRRWLHGPAEALDRGLPVGVETGGDNSRDCARLIIVPEVARYTDRAESLSVALVGIALPGVHDEGVIDRDDRDGVDALVLLFQSPGRREATSLTPAVTDSIEKKVGGLVARRLSSRDPKPMPSEPQALPNAMSRRAMPAPSSRLYAIKCPRDQATAITRGASLRSRASRRAASMIVTAFSSLSMV